MKTDLRQRTYASSPVHFNRGDEREYGSPLFLVNLRRKETLIDPSTPTPQTTEQRHKETVANSPSKSLEISESTSNSPSAISVTTSSALHSLDHRLASPHRTETHRQPPPILGPPI
ncbi:hypothetical protein F2P81_009551 [Scophthalmus maximus]|uniref:Uncharacterized protein n=1 Tax=Scophthalmus maximus TaxID=52904 RepID=A0A6A4SZD9_SCOMX|nr:hypothetical protein F2P81_009551 [Scophthalmus maximus]